jgi:hypothetical protein
MKFERGRRNQYMTNVLLLTGQVVCTSAMSLSLSLGTLSNSLNHRSRLLAIRHSSRGVNQPLFDRYGAIRSFFKQQSTSTVELPFEPPSCGSHNDFRGSTMGNVESLRQFHSCARRDSSRRPRKEVHDNHEKSFPDKPNASVSSDHLLNVGNQVDKHVNRPAQLSNFSCLDHRDSA